MPSEGEPYSLGDYRTEAVAIRKELRKIDARLTTMIRELDMAVD